jgi:hypothetical protein
MDEGGCSCRHGVPAFLFRLGIAHDAQHVFERHLAIFGRDKGLAG